MKVGLVPNLDFSANNIYLKNIPQKGLSLLIARSQTFLFARALSNSTMSSREQAAFSEFYGVSCVSVLCFLHV